MRQNLAAAAAILAVIAVVMLAALLAGSGTLLYAAEGNTSTSDHTDPSSIAVMTTEEAETILPLMEDIIGLSYDSVYQISIDDPEYAARYLAAYENSVSRLGTNIVKISLTKTDINTYKKEASSLDTSIQIILNDVVRLEEIDELKKQYAAEGNILGSFSLEAESLLIRNELALTAMNYADSADIMAQIAAYYGLDVSQLQDSVLLINQIITDATSGKITITTDSSGKLIIKDTSGSSINTDTSGLITLTVYPVKGYYGDKILVSGIASNTGSILSIYWDTNLWGTVAKDTEGVFAKSMTIGRISEGIHAVTVQSEGITSKPVYITILSKPSVVTILKDEQENGELHRKLTLYGSLRTEDDIPVVGAPVTVYSEDHINIGTGITNANGIWNVSAELIDGGYAFYAVFDDPSFPLEGNTSELYPVTILNPTIYYIILAIIGGVLIILIVRFAVRRKPSQKQTGKAGIIPQQIIASEPAIIKVIKEIFKNEKDADDLDELRRIYTTTVVFLASVERIQNIAVLTPREILKGITVSTEYIRDFMSTYEYLHYANVIVTREQMKRMETLSKLIIEGYNET
ncbi:hypothetical protein Mlab_0881 [Methanocorpusculum labreanum Z]|uniref:DUF4129 domain-containing protein n=1 Tax=Methanocorpusculum labreanum (strain ATCC 43576 / DSM 4855 / Z) TaxID=410358 RepID=A2SRU6_METLZ|nr:hypothetical protein [Methanocorpusculum labreanum]ABN07052.1 hypothetical protein Mlab_0881 [Methanocorpusculum labreanum Z]